MTTHFKALSQAALMACACLPSFGWGQSASCVQSATYYAEFYQGLYTMHRHGLDKFPTDSADRQLYFFQVQRNGDKVETNIVKSVHADNGLSANDKTKLMELHHAVGQRLRDMAAADAMKAQPKDKASALLALQEACL